MNNQDRGKDRGVKETNHIADASFYGTSISVLLNRASPQVKLERIAETLHCKQNIIYLHIHRFNIFHTTSFNMRYADAGAGVDSKAGVDLGANSGAERTPGRGRILG